jgi:hypothetical protein
MTDDTTIPYETAARETPVLTNSGTKIGALEHVLEVPEGDLRWDRDRRRLCPALHRG